VAVTIEDVFYVAELYHRTLHIKGTLRRD